MIHPKTTVSPNYSQSIKIYIGPTDSRTTVLLTYCPTILYWRLSDFNILFSTSCRQAPTFRLLTLFVDNSCPPENNINVFTYTNYIYKFITVCYILFASKLISIPICKFQNKNLWWHREDIKYVYSQWSFDPLFEKSFHIRFHITQKKKHI